MTKAEQHADFVRYIGELMAKQQESLDLFGISVVHVGEDGIRVVENDSAEFKKFLEEMTKPTSE